MPIWSMAGLSLSAALTAGCSCGAVYATTSSGRPAGFIPSMLNVAYRSTVVVDREGRVRWSQSGDRLMTRSGEEIRRVLELVQRLRTKA